MTKEERKVLEDAAQAARTKADAAHEAAANASEEEAEALQAAADSAENEAQDAQKAVDAAVVTPAEGEEGDEEEEGDIDFEKELAVIENGGKPPAAAPKEPKTELEKAKRALHFNAKRFKELGGDPSEVLGTPPVPPVVVPPADNTFATKEDLAEQEAGKYARTDAERKVVMHHYRTSIKQSGNIVTDIQNAYLIAHKGKIVRSFEEIRRGANVRPMIATPPGRKQPAGAQKSPELSRPEQSIMRARGFAMKPDGSWESKRYVMKYDPVKKDWITAKK